MEHNETPNITIMDENWNSILNAMAFTCTSNKLLTQNANENVSSENIQRLMEYWLPTTQSNRLSTYFRTFLEFGVCSNENRLSPFDLYRPNV